MRIQRAVTAAPGVVHFVPSLVPAAHTSDTKSSLSAQLTVSVPVTARKGGGAPGSPWGPVVRLVLEDQRDLAVQLRRADRPGQPAPAHPLHLAAPAVRRHLADLLDQLPRARQCYPAVRLGPVVLAHLAVQQGQQVLEARLGLRGPEDLEVQQEGHCTLRVPASPGERRSLGIGALAGPFKVARLR